MEALFGVVYTLLGGFANGSFYMPFKKVRGWSWEFFWLVGGLFSWVIAPVAFSFATVPALAEVFREATGAELARPLVFGILWGIGSLTFGLSMRYLGISLGMALALGLTLVFGALLPSTFVTIDTAFFADFFPRAASLGEMAKTASGQVTFLGIALCLAGIALNGKAGSMKDRALSTEQKQEGIKEFNFRKGVLVAIFSGVMNSAFAMGVAAGKPLSDIAKSHGTSAVFENNPSFILIMLGGFIVNLFWCGSLQVKNRSYRDPVRHPSLRNLLLCALGGVLWYLQMFFYGMGESILSAVAGWSILMSSSILFSVMWGIVSNEWRSVDRRTTIMLWTGIGVLILSTLVFGYAKQL